MWCEGVFWIRVPQSMDHRTRTVGAHKSGQFVEHLSDCTVTKNLYVQKSRNFGFALILYSLFRRQHEKNTAAITELGQTLLWIYQATNHPILWRIFFAEIVTPFTVMKRKDCHKRWAFIRPPQTPRRGWRWLDL
jgi:hypothetical protein